MLTREQAQNLAKQVLAGSTFPECSVVVSSSEQAFTRFANNGITTSALANRHSVSIAATREGRTGTTVSNDLDPATLKEAMRRAEELAALAPVNPEHAVPLGPQEYPETKDYDELTAQARAPEMLRGIRSVIDVSAKRQLVAAGLFERTTSAVAIANKAGLFGFQRAADSKLTVTVRKPDGSSSGWAGQPSTRIAEIDGAALATVAADKCARWKNPRRLDPGKYTVVFEPTATGDIVNLLGGGFMTQGFSARAAEEGRSFLSKRGGGTKLGETLFPPFITLRTDPFDPRLPSSPWTNDLFPTRKITWIDQGKIANLALDRYWAEKTKRQPTPATTSLILEGGDSSLDQLIKSVDRGLLVTHFWYIRFVNPQTQQYTGLTRDGLFLIEKGQVSEPVMNFRFNDGPLNLLKNALKLGPPTRIRGLEGATMVAPALVASDFSFTSVSDAV